jgi:hypothetical protein
MNDEAEKPAFEVKGGAHAFKVYASGRIEGFPTAASIIINRIPQILGEARVKAFELGRGDAL